MMDLRLPQTSNKLENAWALLAMLGSAEDAVSFTALFSALLTACRSIPDVIDREVKPVLRANKSEAGKKLLAEFTQWAAAKSKERRERNSLLEFIETARDEDVHEGKHRLIFPQLHVTSASVSTEGGPPGTSAVVFNPDGAFYVVDDGTPYQRRVPVAMHAAVAVHLDTPLTLHLGQKIDVPNPVEAGSIAVHYYADLAWDARQRFTN